MYLAPYIIGAQGKCLHPCMHGFILIDTVLYDCLSLLDLVRKTSQIHTFLLHVLSFQILLNIPNLFHLLLATLRRISTCIF